MRKILLLSFFLCPAIAPAQSSVYFSVYTGSFDMKRMKQVLLEAKNNGPVGLAVSHNFTGGFQWELEWSASSGKNIYGIYFNHAKSYGELRYQSEFARLTAARGILGFIDYYKFGKHFAAGGRAGLCYSTLTPSSSSGVTTSLGGGFNSVGYSINPSLLWLGNLGVFGLRFEAGYELNHQGPTTYDKDNSKHLVTDSGESATMNWSGVRVGAGICYRFGREGGEREVSRQY